MGDGVLAYFGYPQAHEDDAERAVRAGAGADRGGGRAQERRHSCKRASALPPGWSWSAIWSMRARLAGARHHRRDAEPRGARAGASPSRTPSSSPSSTRRLLGNLFELQDLGAKELKGITGPVRVLAALRASSAESRFEALHASGLTAARRPRRRNRTAAAALGESKRRRRSGGAALRRGRHRQIAADGGAAGTPRRRAAHALALFLLAAAHRQRVLSDHRPAGTRRRAWRTTTRRKRSSTSSMRCWRRPRPPNRTPRSLPSCCRCRTTDAIPRLN